MNISDLLSSLLSWVFALIGGLGLILGLSFLPALFGYTNPDAVFITIGSVALSKGILAFFSYPFGIGVLIVATALFVWVSLLFSMSFHTLVESVVLYFDEEREEGMVAAWVAVLIANFFLVSLFVFILFGMILTPATLLIGALILMAMGALLAANYRETYHI